MPSNEKDAIFLRPILIAVKIRTVLEKTNDSYCHECRVHARNIFVEGPVFREWQGNLLLAMNRDVDHTLVYTEAFDSEDPFSSGENE
jgi:hypothetical protein